MALLVELSRNSDILLPLFVTTGLAALLTEQVRQQLDDTLPPPAQHHSAPTRASVAVPPSPHVDRAVPTRARQLGAFNDPCAS